MNNHQLYELHQLPNGDLWRGNRENAPLTTVDHVEEAFGTPLARAMANILKAKGANKEFPCLWCGQQFGSEKTITEHLLAAHSSVMNPPSDAQIALAEVTTKKA